MFFAPFRAFRGKTFFIVLMSPGFSLQYFLPQKCARYAISLMAFIFCGFCASLRLTECIPSQELLSKRFDFRLMMVDF
jgi:hypothetical protein